ncbi:MAG: hypothetical protein LWX07_01010 [Bacteroidetes bacterium]|nr:hypothetical protein [Bacteroidota bacterium]
MKKYFAVILILAALSSANAQLGSYAGSFARMGFGARGLAMGNTLVSDRYGDISGYYNPSLSCFQENGIVNLGYTFLSLDRKLNFVSFAKKFSLSGGKQVAGISLSWINAGVSDIDGRDNDARSIGMLSTYENQFLMGMSFLVSPEMSLGVGIKLYHSKLFEGVTSTSVGFDAGITYLATKDLTFGLSARDIGVKYKWVTSDPSVYGNSGTTSEDRFPVLVGFGGTYNLPNKLGIVSAGFDTYINPRFQTTDTLGVETESKRNYNFALKVGCEINLNEYVKLRAGIDRMDLKSDDFFGNIQPGAGIGLMKSFSKDINLGVDYSFQLEPYTHRPVQNIGIAFKFK